MRNRTVSIAVLSLLAGVGIGNSLPSHFLSAHKAATTHSVAAASEATPTVPLECRSAMKLGTEGFGVALEGLGQTRAAVTNVNPANVASTAIGVLGQSNARLQGVVQQYNQAVAACNGPVSAASTSVELKGN